MIVDPWMWWAFAAGFSALLAVDLFGRRGSRTVSLKEAGAWSALWISFGLLFGAVLWAWQGSQTAGEYLAGYLIEYSLSVDNIFVFAVILGYFSVPSEYRHKVLFWGILGAIVLRGVFIFGGAALINHFEWAIYIFGAFLVITAIRMGIKGDEEIDPADNPVLKLLQRKLPVSEDYDGPKLLSRQEGRLVATPMMVVLVGLNVIDVIFAFDSIPAIFGVTTNTFIVFTSNAFAILGLRSLYFLLEGVMDRFVYLNYGLAVILGFVGCKMLISDLIEIPIWTSIVVIVAVLGATIFLSWRKQPTRQEDEEPAAAGTSGHAPAP
jgi:TerC family integral membrane protein